MRLSINLIVFVAAAAFALAGCDPDNHLGPLSEAVDAGVTAKSDCCACGNAAVSVVVPEVPTNLIPCSVSTLPNGK